MFLRYLPGVPLSFKKAGNFPMKMVIKGKCKNFPPILNCVSFGGTPDKVTLWSIRNQLCLSHKRRTCGWCSQSATGAPPLITATVISNCPRSDNEMGWGTLSDGGLERSAVATENRVAQPRRGTAVAAFAYPPWIRVDVEFPAQTLRLLLSDFAGAYRDCGQEGMKCDLIQWE